VGTGAIGAVAVDHPVGGRLALARYQVANRVGATTASPLVAALTSAAVMISESGSAAMWPL
jgi:hypothetical protein